MAAKKKKAPVMESVAASEHATEGETKRKVIELPGMVGEGVEKPQVEALDDAVLDYVKERDIRILHGTKEKANKKLILALMEKHSLSSYAVDDLVVVRKPKDETDSIKVVALADYVGDNKGGEEDKD